MRYLVAVIVAVLVALGMAWGSNLLGMPAPRAVDAAMGAVAGGMYLAATKRRPPSAPMD